MTPTEVAGVASPPIAARSVSAGVAAAESLGIADSEGTGVPTSVSTEGSLGRWEAWSRRVVTVSP